MTEFAQEAAEGWDAWSQPHGTELIAATGSLLITDDPDTDTAALRPRPTGR